MLTAAEQRSLTTLTAMLATAGGFVTAAKEPVGPVGADGPLVPTVTVTLRGETRRIQRPTFRQAAVELSDWALERYWSKP